MANKESKKRGDARLGVRFHQCYRQGREPDSEFCRSATGRRVTVILLHVLRHCTTSILLYLCVDAHDYNIHHDGVEI